MQNHIEVESPIKLSESVNYFHTLLNSRDYDTGIDIHCESGKNNPIDFPFTPKEVQVGISSLINEFIKVSADIFLPLLVKLFNKVLQNGRMPELWNLSLITTLYKSGDPGNCSNYRGLCVTRCLGKLFNRLLQTRLTNYLESEGM